MFLGATERQIGNEDLWFWVSIGKFLETSPKSVIVSGLGFSKRE
jgi:hypothetical protein